MSTIKHGTSDFNKVKWALFAGGFNTFAVLYSTQPLMPEFSKEFGVSPRSSEFLQGVRSFSNCCLAVLVDDDGGVGSLHAVVWLVVGSEGTQAEEIEPTNLGLAMGLYISGNSIGGMGGRIITGMLTDWFDWRVALFGVGLLSAAGSLLFWFLYVGSSVGGTAGGMFWADYGWGGVVGMIACLLLLALVLSIRLSSIAPIAAPTKGEAK